MSVFTVAADDQRHKDEACGCPLCVGDVLDRIDMVVWTATESGRSDRGVVAGCRSRSNIL
ncbi:hypothetical protein NOVOSPHI9U_100009 [Novosphingobium sp. 9U]|nr:hypothetical protein NOVOSPHI9U_100009 [Novosphingobium sp. 9U]